MARISLGVLSKGEIHAFPAGQPQNGKIEVLFVTKTGSSKSTDTAKLEVILDNETKILKDFTRQNNAVKTITPNRAIVSIKNKGPSELSVTVITP